MDRSLIPMPDGEFHPAWYFWQSTSFKGLNAEEQEKLRKLFDAMRREWETEWEKDARSLLSMLRSTTDMLVCAEDLGDVPKSVPHVLKDLEILSLRISRWTREYAKPDAPFIPPAAYPRLSVATASVHDTSTLRGWWEENAQEREAFHKALGLPGPCPQKMSPEILEKSIRYVMGADSILAIFQLQDLLDLDTEELEPRSKGRPRERARHKHRMELDMAHAPWTGGSPVPRGARGKARRSLRGARKETAVTEGPTFRFHISAEARKKYGFKGELFSSRGNVVLMDIRQVRLLTQEINEKRRAAGDAGWLGAADMNAMGLIDEVLHLMTRLYVRQTNPTAFAAALESLDGKLGAAAVDEILVLFLERFPPPEVYSGTRTARDYLQDRTEGTPNREITLEELLHLWISNANPAFSPFEELLKSADLPRRAEYTRTLQGVSEFFATQPVFGPDNQDLVTLLCAPMKAAPHSLSGQLEFIRARWGHLLGDLLLRILMSLDLIKEEERLRLAMFAPGPPEVLEYAGQYAEPEAFSADKDWMPTCVMLAKNTLVWLDQLSRAYSRAITRLDQVPDEELDRIARAGFTALWLIGVWERSRASRKIKRMMGNPEAEASAYSLWDYEIAAELGGEDALRNLRERAWRRGVRLASDMVPNHTGIDSRWMIEHPDRFLAYPRPYPPFPSYAFRGPNLAEDARVGVFLEDHYVSRTDAAVVFKRADLATGDSRYIYHGNDGTHMPWNDTAQLDFLQPRNAGSGDPHHPPRGLPIPHHPVRRGHDPHQETLPAPVVPRARPRRGHPFPRRVRNQQRSISTTQCPRSSGGRWWTGWLPKPPTPFFLRRPSGSWRGSSCAPWACTASTTAPS